MNLVWGVVVAALSLLAWGGQTLVALAPDTAQRLSLSESRDEVEPTYWADIRGEALWDALTLWIMVVAGLLLIVEAAAWPYVGLVGGGMYVYFAGRGIATRLTWRGRGYRVGSPESVRLGLAMLAVWGFMGLVTIVAAAATLAAA